MMDVGLVLHVDKVLLGILSCASWLLLISGPTYERWIGDLPKCVVCQYSLTLNVFTVPMYGTVGHVPTIHDSVARGRHQR